MNSSLSSHPGSVCSVRWLQLLLLALFTLLPPAAAAHTGVDGHGHAGFATGFLHPLFGIDHLTAMVGVGLWSALSTRRSGLELTWAPFGFLTMLLVGALMGQQGIELPAVEPMIAVSLLVFGLLIASRLKVPRVFAMLIVCPFAVFHGLAHGYELAGSPNAAMTLSGMLLATVLLHLLGLGAGLYLRQRDVWVARAVGVSVTMLGVGLLTAAT